MSQTKRLDNKIALVTGSSNGIGKSIVDLFLENGATVIGVDVEESSIDRSLTKDKNTNLNDNNNYKRSFQFHQMDVSEEEEWIKLEAIISTSYKSLDILVNNAGINGLEENCYQDPERIDIDSWKYIHKNNLESAVLGCKHMIKLMKREIGDASIINIASRSGLIGVPSLIAYASSKAAVINLTKSVALYCTDKKYNIRCNVINPGAIETKIWDSILGFGQERILRKKQLIQEIPLNNMGQAIDVAYSALYLASEESKFVTASSILIDGGCTATTAGRPMKK